MSILSRLWNAIDAFTAMLGRLTTIGNTVAGEMEQRLGLPAPGDSNENGHAVPNRLTLPRRRIDTGK